MEVCVFIYVCSYGMGGVNTVKVNLICFLTLTCFWVFFWGGVLMLAEKALAFKTKVCDCDRHTVHWDHESHIFEGFFFFSSNWMMQAQHILPWSTKGSTKIVWRWSQYGDIIKLTLLQLKIGVLHFNSPEVTLRSCWSVSEDTGRFNAGFLTVFVFIVCNVCITCICLKCLNMSLIVTLWKPIHWHSQASWVIA